MCALITERQFGRKIIKQILKELFRIWGFCQEWDEKFDAARVCVC